MDKKNNNRVFIFGAGVSKAVAGAPVMKELFSKMRERYEYEKKRTDIPGRNNRVLWFERIERFMDKLESEAKRRFSRIEKNEKNLQIKSTIQEDIEYLITLLDIHTEHSAMFKFNQPGVDWDTYPFIPFIYTNREEIREVRGSLQVYLYLCLCNLEDECGLLEKFFREHLKRNDHLITFNYDLLIEKALWKISRWSPVVGYLGVDQFQYKEDKKRLIESGYEHSAYRILKLHGSMNWKWEYPGLCPETHPVITLDDLEKGGFSLPGLEGILKRPSMKDLIGRDYEGGYSPPWILPSYVKVFGKAPFLVKIWREAQRILTQAKRVVMLGYSFPQADSQSQLLLASLPDDCSILIVNPDADIIKTRMNKLFQSSEILAKNMGFKEWIEKGYPGL